jgi:hypothetical protein
MNDPLSIELPDRLVKIDDDAEAKRFAFALGIWSELSKDITLEGDAAIAHDETAWIAFFDHPTHWILAGRVHNTETEIGFIIFGWPHNRWPRMVVQDFLAKMPLGDSPTVRIEMFGDSKRPLQS